MDPLSHHIICSYKQIVGNALELLIWGPNGYYKQLIFSDNSTTMFWNYIIAANYLLPSPTIEPTQPTITDIKVEEEPLKQTDQNHSMVVNVTLKDLQKAGYESNKTPWSEEEDALLKKLRDEQQMDWADIADQIPSRNSKMCYSRYRRLENHTKEIWRKADDKLLLELVDEHGQDWKEISKHFPKRTHKQIKEHYINYLRPEIKRDDWTLDEDMRLVDLLNEHGKNWKIIEELLGDRTQNQIKNRYFGRLKRISDKKIALKDKAKAEALEGGNH